MHALAVAARHPALVRRVGIVAGLPPFAAYAEPGVLDGASDDRRAVAELGAEMEPPGVGELLAPLIAPWPCDLDLAREYVLEGADAVRRAELDAVPGALDAMAAGVVDAVAQGLDGLAARHRAAGHAARHRARRRRAAPCRSGTAPRTAPPRRRSATGSPPTSRTPTLDVLDGAGHCFVLPRWAEVLGALVA